MLNRNGFPYNMRVLLIAPKQTNLHTFPEVRTIVASNHVNLMIEEVTARAVYEAVRNDRYDIIHFATHTRLHKPGPDDANTISNQSATTHSNGTGFVTSPSGIVTPGSRNPTSYDRCLVLDNDECLSQEEVAQIARTAGAKLLFFNSCDTAGIAAYVVRHGIPHAIFTTQPLFDKYAWQMPSAFYTILARRNLGSNPATQPIEAHYGGVLTGINYPEVFSQADSGDGIYGLATDPEQVASAQLVGQQVATMVSTITSLKGQIRNLYLAQFGIVLAIIYLWQMGIVRWHIQIIPTRVETSNRSQISHLPSMLR